MTQTSEIATEENYEAEADTAKITAEITKATVRTPAVEITAEVVTTADTVIVA